MVSHHEWSACCQKAGWGRGGPRMGEIHLVRSRGEGHESSICSQYVGSLFLVLLLPSSSLASPVALSTGRACPVQWASAGRSTRHIFPWKLMHWTPHGKISLSQTLGAIDELSLWTKLRTRTYLMMFLPTCSCTLGPSLAATSPLFIRTEITYWHH